METERGEEALDTRELMRLVSELEAKSAALRDENDELRRAKALATGASGLSAAYNDAAQQHKLSAAALAHAQRHEEESAALLAVAREERESARLREARTTAWCAAVLQSASEHACDVADTSLEASLAFIEAVAAALSAAQPNAESPEIGADVSTQCAVTVMADAEAGIEQTPVVHQATQMVEVLRANATSQVSPPATPLVTSSASGPRAASVVLHSRHTSVDARTVDTNEPSLARVDSLAHAVACEAQDDDDDDDDDDDGSASSSSTTKARSSASASPSPDGEHAEASPEPSALSPLAARASAPYGASRSPSPSRLVPPRNRRTAPADETTQVVEAPPTSTEAPPSDTTALTSNDSLVSGAAAAGGTNTSFAGVRSNSSFAGAPRTHEQLEEALLHSERARAAANATIAQLRTKIDDAAKEAVVQESHLTELRKAAASAEDRVRVANEQLAGRKSEAQRLERTVTKLRKQLQDAEKKASDATADGRDGDAAGEGEGASPSPARKRVPPSERVRPWLTPPASLRPHGKSRSTQTDVAGEASVCDDGDASPSPCRASGALDDGARTALQQLLQEVAAADEAVDRLLLREKEEADKPRREGSEGRHSTETILIEESPSPPRKLHSASAPRSTLDDAGTPQPLDSAWPEFLSQSGDAFLATLALKQQIASDAAGAVQRLRFARVTQQLSHMRAVLQTEAAALAQRAKRDARRHASPSPPAKRHDPAPSAAT